MIISTDLDPKELPPGLTLPELQAKLDKLVKGAAGLVGLFVKPLSQCSLDRSRHFAADMWPVPGRPGSVFSLATCHAARQRSSCDVTSASLWAYQARLHADFVVAGRRPRYGDATDDIIARLDRKSPANRYHARQLLLAHNGIAVVETLGIRGSVGANRVCRVGLAAGQYDGGLFVPSRTFDL
jgi:hypothetical protein